MESVIAGLVNQFERGALSRRDLVQGLLALTATGSVALASPFQETPFKPTRIDHISIQVTDLPRSIVFYQKVFGLSILNEDKANEIVRMGTTRTIVSLHHKPPTGIMDHYAIAIDGFDRDSVTRALKQLGLTAEENLDYGFYVRDPEGTPSFILDSNRSNGSLLLETKIMDKTDVWQGTLALMVLKTLAALGPQHGYGIARRIEQTSGNLLAINQGTLYPILLKLEQERSISSEWGISDNNRKARFYNITKRGKKALAVEEREWQRTNDIIARFSALGETE
jgi:PadR family transcriptional regulator